MRISHLKYVGLLAIATAVLFSAPTTAASQERFFACEANLGTALSEMEKAFGEFAFVTAESEHGNFTVFTVNPESHAWSMLLTMPNGQVCMVHYGQNWNLAIISQGEPS